MLTLVLATILTQPYTPPPVLVDDTKKGWVSSYADGAAIALKSGKPLVTFVGCYVTATGDYVVASTRVLEGYPAQCIVIAVPDKGYLYWQATLPITATEVDIVKAVSQQALPFQPSSDPFDPSNKRTTAQREGQLGGRAVGLQHNASHNCPSCGARQTIVSGQGPNGTHTHTCPRCQTTWYH